MLRLCRLWYRPFFTLVVSSLTALFAGPRARLLAALVPVLWCIMRRNRYGDLGDVYMPRDLRSGDPRGFAFVRYMDQRDAEDAIDRLDGEFFAGRELRIQVRVFGEERCLAGECFFRMTDLLMLSIFGEQGGYRTVGGCVP